MALQRRDDSDVVSGVNTEGSARMMPRTKDGREPYAGDTRHDCVREGCGGVEGLTPEGAMMCSLTKMRRWVAAGRCEGL